MTDQTLFSVQPGSTITVQPAAGSPRALVIIRDVLISLAALLFILGAVYTAVAVNQAGNTLEEIGTTFEEPGFPTDPTYIPPGD